MGQNPSALESCVSTVCDGRSDCMAASNKPFYDTAWAIRRNLDIETHSAVTYRPNTAEDVAAAIKCAVESNVTVQAISGGHSFGNHGVATEGSLVIDLRNINGFEIDESTWVARLGGGLSLGDVDEHMLKNGDRAMAHGTCPSVGIGGHASVGGLGPMSRMWGSALDHVLEVEVVTADGSIERANETHNSDLFWAIRGAGASFGIVTEYVVKTHEAPGRVLEYTYSFSFGSQKDMIPVYTEWQALAADPDLDRRFSTQFIAQPLGAIVTGTFYGTEEEFEATGILEKMPGGAPLELEVFDWAADLIHQAETAGLYLADLPAPFDGKSLALPEENLLSEDEIEELFTYMDEEKWSTLLWFIIFNTEGGAMTDRSSNETAYPHRDTLIMYQSYAIGIPVVTQAVRDFVGGVHERIQAGGAKHAYAGYIDPDLDRATAQEVYWGDNLPQLREVKKKWDPTEVFRNPQSVEPAG